MLARSTATLAPRRAAHYCRRPTRCRVATRPASVQTATCTRTEARTDCQIVLEFSRHAQEHPETWLNASAQNARTTLKDLAGASRQDVLHVGRQLHACVCRWLRDELKHHQQQEVMEQLQVQHITDDAILQLLLSYAVCSSDRALVSRLLDEGAAPNPSGSSMPVLAPAILNSDHAMVQLLLARGANPYGIPTDLYLPAMREQGMHGLATADEDSAHASHAAWCTTDRLLLQEALDVQVDAGMLMSYYLARATKMPALTDTAVTMMKANQLERVPALRMLCIGQEAASYLVYNQVTAYFGMPDRTNPHNKPLVLLLAGPPGHGKTLIGQQLKNMMGTAHLFVDCSKVHHIVDLLGASGPFKNSEQAPPFVAFTRQHSGKRSIVVLDEFEKMDVRWGDVQNSLLGVLQDGWYVDPYSKEQVDCSNTIFLLTTNAADSAILEWWKTNQDNILQSALRPAELQRVLRPLEKEIRTQMAARTSRSLTSRLSGVIPFLPFTEFETKLVVQHALLQQQQELKAPVDVPAGRLHGNITLELRDQPEVLKRLADELYCEEEGARAVINGIQSTVGLDIKSAVLEERATAVGGCVTMTKGQGDLSYELEMS